MHNSYKLNRVDTDRDGWIQISYEQFMNVSLSSTSVSEILTQVKKDGS